MLTVAYITFRINPRFEWFCSSLKREMQASGYEDLQIVVIDGRVWYDDQRASKMLEWCGDRFKFEHYSPKPTVWQGPTRLTSKDYFAAASVRNTAFCYAKRQQVAFVDDLSVLLPGWLKMHLKAAEDGYALCGTTCKNKNIEVDSEGTIQAFEFFPPGQDTRIPQIKESPNGLTPCGGTWMYGGTFSVPLEKALAVNGQDEIHDIIGGEDYDFGIRLTRAGTALYISKACGTFEDEDGHHTEAPMCRLDKPWPPDGRNPGWDGPYVSNLLLNRLMREETRAHTLGVQPNLRELRDKIQKGEAFPVPTEPSRYFSDNQPLSEM